MDSSQKDTYIRDQWTPQMRKKKVRIWSYGYACGHRQLIIIIIIMIRLIIHTWSDWAKWLSCSLDKLIRNIYIYIYIDDDDDNDDDVMMMMMMMMMAHNTVEPFHPA